MIEVSRPRPAAADRGEPFTADLRTARFAETARTVFAGPETLGRLGRHRIVVVTERDERLAQRVNLVRRMLARLEGGARVWIEGLPADERRSRRAAGRAGAPVLGTCPGPVRRRRGPVA